MRENECFINEKMGNALISLINSGRS